MKAYAIILLISFVTGISAFHSLSAQEKFEDLIKKSRKEFDEMKKEADKELEEMKKSIDAEFAEILNRAWKELELNTGRKLDTTPKPVKPPVARPKQAPVKEPPEKPVKEPEEKAPEKKPEPEIPKKKPTPEPAEKKPSARKVREEKPAPPKPKKEYKPVKPEAKEGEPLTFVFYDTPISITYDIGMKVDIGNTISEKTISSFWKAISARKYQSCLEQVYALKGQLRLNDWGYCIFLDEVAKNIFGRSTNQRNVFVWFMLVKSGYDARIGYSGNQVYLLLPTMNRLYSVPYYEMNNTTYYITFLGTTPKSVKSLYTYEGSHKGADRQIDMKIVNPPEINKKVRQKEYTFAYFDKKYRVPVNVNTNVIDYYEFYPQTSLDVYFDASISAESGKALLDGLKPLIRNKSEAEAVNILLRFVQTAFKYQTDNEQFQREKHLFVEETLFYPYSDCEDRSFLFSFLVGNLIGLDVIGLHYPGHVATAVKFNGDAKGDYITYKNVKYIICDPTFINSNYGECMPKFKNVSPKIVPVEIN